MPSIQTRPVDVSQILRAYDARLTKLETFPPSGITLIATNDTGIRNDVYGQNTVEGNLNSTITAPTFVLHRPVPIMVFGSMVFFTSGGTASYAYGHLNLWDSTNNN